MKTLPSLLLVSCLLISGCVSTVFSGANAVYNHSRLQQTASNYYILLRAKHAIENDPSLAQADISVTCFNQLVLLTGQAPSAAMRQHAAEVIKNIPRIIRIFNAITVGPPLPADVQTSDTWITTKIKTKLIANNDIDPNKIKVVTENGIVYLLGIIPREQADIAINLAQNTNGVQKVVTIFYYIIMPKIN